MCSRKQVNTRAISNLLGDHCTSSALRNSCWLVVCGQLLLSGSCTKNKRMMMAFSMSHTVARRHLVAITKHCAPPSCSTLAHKLCIYMPLTLCIVTLPDRELCSFRQLAPCKIISRKKKWSNNKLVSSNNESSSNSCRLHYSYLSIVETCP